MPVHIHISHAPENKKSAVTLCHHLQPMSQPADPGALTLWHEGELIAGENIDDARADSQAKADIYLFLLTGDFISTERYRTEAEQALQQTKLRGGHVVPILLSSCLWDNPPLGGLQPLPKNGLPVKSWPNEEEALEDIARGVADLVAKFPGRMSRGSGTISSQKQTAQPKTPPTGIQAQGPSQPPPPEPWPDPPREKPPYAPRDEVPIPREPVIQRAQQKDIPIDEYFNIDAVYNLEHNYLIEKLKEDAHRALSDPSIRLEEALEEAPWVVSGMIRYFGNIPKHIDQQLLITARMGRLKATAPDPTTTKILSALTWILLTMEVVLGLLFVLFPGSEGPSAIPLIVGTMLAIGAFFAARGAADMAMWVHPVLDRSADRTPLFGALAQLIPGVGLVVAGAWLRAQQANEIEPILLTCGLAVAATLCGATTFYRKEAYRYLLIKMFECQVWNATERHAGDERILQDRYTLEVTRLWRGRRTSARGT